MAQVEGQIAKPCGQQPVSNGPWESLQINAHHHSRSINIDTHMQDIGPCGEAKPNNHCHCTKPANGDVDLTAGVATNTMGQGCLESTTFLPPSCNCQGRDRAFYRTRHAADSLSQGMALNEKGEFPKARSFCCRTAKE